MKSSSVTIQMKASEQYLPVVLFIILCREVLTSEPVDDTLTTTQMKVTYQYCPEMLFVIMHKTVLTLESVNEILSVTMFLTVRARN